MRKALWIVQVLLAVFSLLAGISHGVIPLEEAVKSAPWVTSVSPVLVRFIGWCEIAGAVGLTLPAATRILPWLTPLAAALLALLMVLAAGFHVMRGEPRIIPMHLTVAALALFVAWGRTARAPISSRG
jgi:hypothetical protein